MLSPHLRTHSMDFLLSGVFARQEAYFLFANAVFLAVSLFWYAAEGAYRAYDFLFSKPSSEPVSEAGTVKSSQDTGADADVAPAPFRDFDEGKREVTADERVVLSEVAKSVKTKMARGEFTEARAKIIEGLTIDKFDKELNCLLASIYERSGDYAKSELLYKDLIVVHDTDPELFLKLGFALSMQGKYEIAFEIYKKLHSITSGSDESVEMLSNLAYQLKRYEDAEAYAREYLKKHPRNAEILNLLAGAQASLGKREEAIKTLEKLRVVDPYNVKIREFSEKLATELELEKNFHTSQS